MRAWLDYPAALARERNSVIRRITRAMEERLEEAARPVWGLRLARSQHEDLAAKPF